MKEDRLRFNFNRNDDERNKPLSARTSVITHRLFMSLDREAAQRYLMNSFPGEFIARKSSLGDGYLAFTMVAKENNQEQTRIRNSKGYFIAHVLIYSFYLKLLVFKFDILAIIPT